MGQYIFNLVKYIKNLIFIIILFTNIFAYETIKITQIISNPEKYRDKNVLLYVKFDKFIEDNFSGKGIIFDLNINDIKYKYNLDNKNLSEKIRKLKNRDKITIKGKVIINGFFPEVEIYDINIGWVDTNLLPLTPENIMIICPYCGQKFKYQITQNDYKKSILDKKGNDKITLNVAQKEIKQNKDIDINLNFYNKQNNINLDKNNNKDKKQNEPMQKNISNVQDIKESDASDWSF